MHGAFEKGTCGCAGAMLLNRRLHNVDGSGEHPLLQVGGQQLGRRSDCMKDSSNVGIKGVQGPSALAPSACLVAEPGGERPRVEMPPPRRACWGS